VPPAGPLCSPSAQPLHRWGRRGCSAWTRGARCRRGDRWKHRRRRHRSACTRGLRGRAAYGTWSRRRRWCCSRQSCGLPASGTRCTRPARPGGRLDARQGREAGDEDAAQGGPEAGVGHVKDLYAEHVLAPLEVDVVDVFEVGSVEVVDRRVVFLQCLVVNANNADQVDEAEDQVGQEGRAELELFAFGGLQRVG
jgi:hypothetical protein